ncbi:ATP-dependent Clp protease proteolytic subunit [Aliisedimentitalea scapharcae]|uniref:ATP-dependent Clp protease proteolytic subunit n=1 Tax=Aliisedimentitalea scapharcae TaxID=1524259 RepID=A0ABZ2XVF8_9RHOB
MHLFLTFFALLVGTLAGSLDTQARDVNNGKFMVAGHTLIYNSDLAVVGDNDEVANEDIDTLLTLLRANPDISVLELNSEGGSVYAGMEMARIVIDFGLDTIVSGECFSSCVTIFLGGSKRQMMLGSKIGFHQTAWPPAAIAEYYGEWRESEGWETPFDFAAWVYADTQTEVFEDLTYMIERGVDPEFAIRTKGIRNSDFWYPSRLELTNAGVLRD